MAKQWYLSVCRLRRPGKLGLISCRLRDSFHKQTKPLATLAQSVEQHFRKVKVPGSIPGGGSRIKTMPEFLNNPNSAILVGGAIIAVLSFFYITFKLFKVLFIIGLALIIFGLARFIV